MTEVTQLLQDLQDGNPMATEQLLPLLYRELREIAASKLRREKPGQTLSATALVHEAFFRLVGPAEQVRWQTKAHFFGAAAEAMRRILIERARQKKRIRHGGNHQRVDLDIALVGEAEDDPVDVEALDEALSILEKNHPLETRIVKLKFFCGLTMDQIAETLDMSLRTAHRKWAFARARLYEIMADPNN